MALLCMNFEDCKHLLGHVEKKQNYTLKTFSLEPFCKDIRGYLGSHQLLTLTVDGDDGERNFSFFVKSLDCAGLLDCFNDANFFEKEVFTYKFFKSVKEVLPSVDISILPKMYYYTADKTIALENLGYSNYRGVTSIHLDKPHTLQALTALAKFHAVTIAFEEHKGEQLGRKYQIDEDYSNVLQETYFNAKEGSCGYKYTKSCEVGARKLIDLVIGDQSTAEDVKQKLSSSMDFFFDMVSGNNTYRNVLCHGDIWGYNVLFKYKNDVPVDCKYVDLQLTRYAPPAHDVTMLVYQASTRSMYQQHIFEYYDFYYKNLRKELNRLNLDISKILPIEEFEETCNVYMPIAKMMYLFFRELTQASNEKKQELFNHQDLFKSIILGEERASFVAENFFNDIIYRDFLTDLIMDYKHIALNESIQVEDCHKIIQAKINSTEYELMDYTAKPLEERGGFLGEHINLQILIKRDNIVDKLKFFVKLEPNVPSQKQFTIDTGASFKEMRFFNKIVPSMSKYSIDIINEVIPRCYLSEMTIIVVDDLKLEGYNVCSSRIPLTLEALKLGLKSMAKLHASGIIYEEKIKEKHNKDLKLNEIYPKEFIETFYTQHEISVGLLQAAKTGIAVLIELFSNYTTNISSKQFFELCKMFIDKYEVLTKPSNTYRNTICHGDLWSHNMMFNGKNCVLIDFQSYRYCPPAHDVMQFIYLCSDRKMRSHYMDHLLDYYYTEFKANIEFYNCNIERILPHKDFLKSCLVEKQMAVTQSLTHFQNKLLSKDSVDELFSDPEFCNKSFFVDRSDLIRKTVMKDEVYCSRIKEALADVRELCEEYAKVNCM